MLSLLRERPEVALSLEELLRDVPRADERPLLPDGLLSDDLLPEDLRSEDLPSDLPDEDPCFSWATPVPEASNKILKRTENTDMYIRRMDMRPLLLLFL
ncbi:MAG TPA: hypothetical protein VFB79_09315 [Candidatus Angelobacter sp.]|nr:hypothetical protein [Candidatus Angelobacter sp.]